MLHSNNSLTGSNNSVWICKMIGNETGEVQQSIDGFPRNCCLKIPRKTCCPIQFLCSATKTKPLFFLLVPDFVLKRTQQHFQLFHKNNMQVPTKRCLSKVIFVTFVKHQLNIIQWSFSLWVNFLLSLILQWLYTNADMKIYQYLLLHIKIICRRFRIITLFAFWDIRTRDYKMFVYKDTETIEYVKNCYLLFKKNTRLLFLYRAKHIVRFSNLH